MHRTYIGIGTRFLLNERVFEIIEKLDGERYKAKDMTFGNVAETFSRSQLLSLLENGSLRFSVEGKNTSGDLVKDYAFEDFQMLPEDVKNDALKRYECIEPLLDLKVTSLNKYIEELVNALKAKGCKVSKSSLYRWYKAYMESNQDIRALVSSTHKCGSSTPKINMEVDIIVDQVIQEFYLKKEVTTLKATYELIYYRIDEKNKQRPIDQQLIHPSLSTVRRRVLKLEDFEVAKSRKGRKYAHDKFGPVHAVEKLSYPLQRVEVDHTKLDLCVVDENHRVALGRPWLTMILDVYTRYPLGFYLGFEPPSFTSVMLALKHAINPKSYVKEIFPNVENEWLAYGIPEMLVMDNGKEFRSKNLDQVCIELGIKKKYCPVKVPWYKGTVERYFRTINQELIHQTPGTTFSNVLQKGEYNPKKNAIISFRTLEEILHIWVIDYYAKDMHEGLKGIPAEMWKTAYEHAPSPAVPSTKLEWKKSLMKTESASIQRHGIRFQNLFYQAHDLKIIASGLKKNSLPNKVMFKYDPTDMSRIYVYDQVMNHYVEAPCTDQEYSNGLNEYMHKEVSAETRKESGKVNKSALARTRAKIQEKIKEEKNLSLKESQKNQRLKGTGSNQLMEKSETMPVEINKAKENAVQTIPEMFEKKSKPKENNDHPPNETQQTLQDMLDEIDYSDWD
ncbi:Mu transposase C-terminal domain-containing protein [Neobacillus drentensis]|uniref:Mu transposase C-terminal domain-containing protein n=1 Tax=Neobacillus drentensis TaxID=220684 RepID=UPI003000BC14